MIDEDEPDFLDSWLKLVWAAGFLDGEGCICIRKTGSRYNLTLSASQMRRKPLEILQVLFGGGISKGKAKHYQWSVAAIKAEDAIRRLLPYLVNKREEAELALKFRSLLPKQGNKADETLRSCLDDIKVEMHELKIMERV